MNHQTFNLFTWQAQTYHTAAEIQAALAQFNVLNKKIVAVKVIGIDKNLGRLDYQAAQMLGFHSHIDMQQLYVPCQMIVCEPIVFYFEDGSSFEIMFLNNNGLKMSCNQIPMNIHDGINHSNIDANILFKEIIGYHIKEISLTDSTAQTTRLNDGYVESAKIKRSFYLKLDKKTYEKSLGLALNRSGDSWFSLSLNEFSNSPINKKIADLKQAEKNIKEQIVIVAGHDGGGYFWIMPVNELGHYEEGDWGCECCYDDKISIDEDDVGRYLSYYLFKYFDNTFEYKCRNNDYWDCSGFQWNLEYNLYPYQTMKAMLQEIQYHSQLLKINLAHPDLIHFSKLCGAYYENPRKLNKKELIKLYKRRDKIIDFYQRFCWCVENMMQKNPNYEFISFMGP